MGKIQDITALEIPDSRGKPTLMVAVALSNGITASACACRPARPAGFGPVSRQSSFERRQSSRTHDSISRIVNDT